MKKTMITILAVSALAEIIAKNPIIEISSPSLHLPNKYWNEIETNIEIKWDRKNGSTYIYNDGFSSETKYNLFSAHVCENGDCFTGISVTKTEKTYCNVNGDCENYNVIDFWATKDEDTAWLNFEIGF